MSATVLWYKRDLRVHDHDALAYASGLGVPVIPLYIVEPAYWALPDTSARQWEFTRECISDLHTALAQLGQPLVIRMGDACDVFNALHKTHAIDQIISHEETGNMWTYARDQRLAQWAQANGVVWKELPQSGIKRRLKTRDQWAATRETYLRRPMASPPAALTPIQITSDPLPSSADLNLAPDPCPGRQIGGRDQALALLGGFLTERGRTYRKDMSSPLAGEWACSRLSPYLTMGCLSGREADQATAARKIDIKGTRDGWVGSLSSFTSRLAWRDHFMQKLEDAPQIETRCMHSAYQQLRQGSNQDRLNAWSHGQTGVPFVDACMRYLRHTGWLNFRMQAMVQSFAAYHLWLDWRDSGMVLARLFTDYEPGIHWPQIQMQSGTTGMNTVRIYNPVKQGYDQDPDGVFTRRWVPELADIPNEYVQEPWRRGGWQGYPPPIVDLKEAAKHARDTIWAVRKGKPFRDEAHAIIKKHASRKQDRGFQRDPQPTEKPTQLKFDL